MNASELSKPAQLLLVEDNEDDIELTIEALNDSKIKMDIHVATNGVEAMQFLRKQGEYEGLPSPDYRRHTDSDL